VHVALGFTETVILVQVFFFIYLYSPFLKPKLILKNTHLYFFKKDINECATNNGGCDQLSTCINLSPGWMCGPCKTGYNMTESGKCVDVDECTPTSPRVCNVTSYCINTIGAYTCSPCRSGYQGTIYNNCTGTTLPLSLSPSLPIKTNGLQIARYRRVCRE